MTYEERNLKGIFAGIGVAMTIFVPLIIILYGGSGSLQNDIVAMFPRSVVAYCITDFLTSAGYFLSFFLPVLIFYAVSRKAGTRPIDLSLRLPEKHTRLKTAAIVFVSLGIILAMAHVNAMLVPTNTDAGLNDVSRTKPYQLVLLVFSSAVIPAFSEELLFRGVFVSNLKPYGKSVAVIVSALMFCFMHMNVAQLLYTFAAGVVFGLVYCETGSVWITVLLHFLNNFFNVLENYLFELFAAETANLFCLALELMIFLLGVVLTAAYLAVKKKEEDEERRVGVFGYTNYVCEKSLHIDSRKTIRLFFCPPIVIFLVLSVIYMVVNIWW